MLFYAVMNVFLWQNKPMRILLIDDDIELCELMTRFLQGEGFQVDAAHDGLHGLKLACAGGYDLAVLDIMMPKKSGMDVLRELRQQSNLPVIMMTARGEEMDRIIGLELGADDYLPKPCNPRELAARIRAILRRSENNNTHDDSAQPNKTFGSLEWRPKSRTILAGSATIELTTMEYNILSVLMQYAGEVVSKHELSKAALGKHFSPFDRSLDVHIGHLRKKIPQTSNQMPRIKTVRSVGWLFIPE
jgi:two-component system response regulator CpxR